LATCFIGTNFFNFTVGAANHTTLTPTPLESEPYVQQLLVIPSFLDRNDHNISTGSQYGQKRETNEILVKAINVDFEIALLGQTDQSPITIPPAYMKCAYKFCLVTSMNNLTQMTTDAPQFLSPWVGGSRTMADKLTVRSKEYRVVKTWSGVLSQKPFGTVYDGANYTTRNAPSSKNEKQYFDYKDGLKIRYGKTDTIGTSQDGKLFYLIGNVWDLSSGNSWIPVSAGTPLDGAVTMRGISTVYYRDRD